MSNGLVKSYDQNPQNEHGKIVVDDGTKVYDIYNHRKEIIGQFVFSPSDMGIVERYDHAVAEFEDIQKTLSGDNSKPAIKAANDRMKAEFDYLFNADVSESFFSITNPFTPLESGEFFAVTVLNAVKSVVEKETMIRLKRAKTRASKYTKKYHR